MDNGISLKLDREEIFKRQDTIIQIIMIDVKQRIFLSLKLLDFHKKIILF